METTDVTRLVREILNQRLFEVADTTVTLAALLLFLLIVLASYAASRLLRRAIERALQRRGTIDPAASELTSHVVHYLVMAIGLAVGLQAMGVDLAALFAAGAIFAVAIGFAMQSIAENFVSGLILLSERSIKPGDILEVEGRVVRVVRMGIRATIARTRDEEELIIPNATLAQSTVKNYTLRDSQYRLRTQVGVVYRADMHIVRRTLEETAESLPWRLPAPEPQIVLTEFGDSSVNFEVRVWLNDPWRDQAFRSKLNEAIWNAFKKSDITIAFPQLDVHFDPPVEETLRGLSRAG